MTTQDKLQRKLEELRTADRQFQIPGADHHHYQLNPCLDERVIQSFEAHYQITLPDDYRQFLVHIGNGGAGPPFALYPLEEAIWVKDDLHFLARPFRYTQWWNGMNPPNWFDLDLSPKEMDRITKESDYSASYHVQGTLRLAHEGCGYYNMLVITGQERGYMWGDRRTGDAGIMPLPETQKKEEQRMTFSQWYNDWLDTSLQQFSVVPKLTTT